MSRTVGGRRQRCWAEWVSYCGGVDGSGGAARLRHRAQPGVIGRDEPGGEEWPRCGFPLGLKVDDRDHRYRMTSPEGAGLGTYARKAKPVSPVARPYIQA